MLGHFLNPIRGTKPLMPPLDKFLDQLLGSCPKKIRNIEFFSSKATTKSIIRTMSWEGNHE